MSRELSEDVAAILAAAGLRVMLFREPVPTPARRLRGQAPRRGGGRGHHGQPQPARVQRLQGVLGERGARSSPRSTRASRPPSSGRPRRAWSRGPRWRCCGAQGAGHRRARRRRGAPTSTPWARSRCTRPRATASLRIVYTPLHGVGDALARRALAEARFTHVESVPEQQRPDGAFPTVAFPNPEEPGAMDLRAGPGDRERGRPRARQRSRRRSARRGGPRRATRTGSSPATSSASSSGTTC